MTQSNIKPLKDLVEPGWANALAEVEPQVHRMGDFLRGEIAAGRRYLPASANILRAFTIPFDSRTAKQLFGPYIAGNTA